MLSCLVVFIYGRISMIVKSHLKIFVLTICFLLSDIVVAAGFGSTLSAPNDDIPKEVREEVGKIHQNVISNLKAGRINVLINLLTEDNKKQKKEAFKKVFKLLHKVFKEKELKIFYENYANSKGVGSNLFSIPSEVSPPFHLSFKGDFSKYYISLSTSCCEVDDKMLGVIYKNSGGEWKILGIYAGTYKLKGKDFKQWYDLSSQHYKDNKCVPAFTSMIMALASSKPVAFLQYDEKKEALVLAKKIKKVCDKDLALPYELNLKSKPVILGMNIGAAKKDLHFLITYKTSLNFEEVALKDEASLIHALLSKKLAGFNEFSDYVIYKAMRDIPKKSNKKPEFFTTLIKNE